MSQKGELKMDCEKCKKIQEDIEELRVQLIEKGNVLTQVTERLWKIANTK